MNQHGRTRRTVLVTLFLTILVAACGGGGGSGSSDGGGSGSLTFTLDRTSIGFDFTENPAGGILPMQTVTATAQGTYSGALYVGAIVEGTAINNIIPAVISGVQGTFQISPAAGLAPGTYTGRVLLLACSDAACNNRLGNTPLAVSYTVIVRPGLKVTPGNSVDISAVSGNEGQQTFTLQLPDGATSFNVTNLSADNMFRVENLSSTSFRIVARSYPVGNYTSTFRVDAGNQFTFLTVAYHVSAPPGGEHNLQVSPANLTFTATEGSTSAPVAVNVTPATWDPTYRATVEYLVSGSRDWVKVTNTANGYQVWADATNLTAGSYSANVVVQGDYPVLAVTIPLAVTVGVGLVRPADIIRTIDANTTTAQLSGSTPINIASGPAVGWTATTDAPWLSLTRASGQTGTNLNYTLDNSAFAALQNGKDYTAQVTVTASLATMTPVTYQLHVTKKLAQVTSIAPYVQLSTKPIRLIVRGVGFDALSNLASGLTIQGAANPVYTKVNDTEVIIEAAAMAVSSYQVQATNQTGNVGTGQTLQVIAPQAYTYGAFATGGTIGSMLYDPERDAVYFANMGLNTLQRYSYTGATWSLTTTSVPAIANLGMTPGGASLVVATSATTSNLRLLDASQTTSFTEQKHFDVPSMQPGHDTIPILNDGRAWFSGSPYSFGSVNLSTGAFTQLQGNPQWLFEDSRFALGRDGERLYIHQNGCCTGAYPFYTLYLDAATSVAHENPAGFERFYWASASEDGNRVVFNSDVVYSRDFEQIGKIVFPGSAATQWIKLESEMSPDGTRTYVIAYAATEFGSTTAPIAKPRIFVIDSSTRNPTQVELPVLGYFEINDYPTCRVFPDCNHPQMSISLDGKTLFLGGDQNFVVAPIPAEGVLSPLSAPGGGSASARSSSMGISTQAWYLNLSKQ
jgi:hypothetical protein